MLEFKGTKTFTRTVSNEQFHDLREGDYVYCVEEQPDGASMEMIRIVKRDEEDIRRDIAYLSKKVRLLSYDKKLDYISHVSVNRTTSCGNINTTVFTDGNIAFDFFKEIWEKKKASKDEDKQVERVKA